MTTFNINSYKSIAIDPMTSFNAFATSGEYVINVNNILQSTGVMTFVVGSSINTLITTINSRLGAYATVSIEPVFKRTTTDVFDKFVVLQTVVITPTNPADVIVQSGSDAIFRAFGMLPNSPQVYGVTPTEQAIISNALRDGV